jgi:hypothetical protein
MGRLHRIGDLPFFGGLLGDRGRRASGWWDVELDWNILQSGTVPVLVEVFGLSAAIALGALIMSRSRNVLRNDDASPTRRRPAKHETGADGSE